MPPCMKLKNGQWERDESLGQQFASEYDRVVWCSPADLPPPGVAFDVDADGNWFALPPPPRAIVPRTKIQLRLFMRAAGKEANWNAFLGALTGDALNEWNECTAVEWEWPMVVSLRSNAVAALGMTEAELRAAFEE